jgi:Putative auto-transporter adhesin, head GIN domain
LKFLECNLEVDFCVKHPASEKHPDICNHKTNNMNRLLLIFLSLVTLTSCHYFHGERVKGNGSIKKENRLAGTAGEFSNVEVSGAIDLYIKQESTASINVETDENLLPYIEVRNNGGTLSIFPKDGYNLDPSQSVKVYVSAPAFKKLEASGACKIISEGMLSSANPVEIGLSGASDAGIDLESPMVSVDCTGASTITLKGKTKDLSLEGSGASHLKCFELLSENADVDISGASSAEVFASVKIKASASGASNILYKGTDAVTKEDSGASSVKKAD